MKKDASLEGLRGYACLVVVLSHCIYAFWPEMHGAYISETSSAWAVAMFNSPFTAVYNGTIAVYVFFVLSGYVLSLSFFRKKEATIVQSLFLRRHLRLAIPITAACLLMYMLHRIGAFSTQSNSLHPWVTQFYQGEYSLSGAIYSGMVSSLLNGDGSYNFVLWTMTIEFYGSILVFANCLLLSGVKKRFIVYCIECAALVIAANYWGYFMICFLVGTFLAEVKNNNQTLSTSNAATFLLLAFALYLGGFHTQSASYGYVANFKEVYSGIYVGHASIFYTISASAIMYCVAFNGSVSKFLSSQTASFWGSISFSLYLVHSLILRSVGVFSFSIFELYGLRYNLSALFSSALVFCVSIIVAVAFRHIDGLSLRVSKAFESFLMSARPSKLIENARMRQL
ncbi:acyltransferase family protein [Brucella oryzae]|uniref:Acyltransferase 3 domain-containing protein n=1 Tax=Brucella oryzae TaxID=335286 RepID=A0A2S7J353_9HYPH|nr:acyltransferase [Brucella oryzae]PQA74682.1 hypothetical protein C3731_05485 [Brucella oryzae]